MSFTLEECKAEALKYATRTNWARGSYATYNAARDNGWLDSCCGHMANVRGKVKPTREYSKAECLEIALQYKSPLEWRYKDHHSYWCALYNNWLPRCVFKPVSDVEEFISMGKPVFRRVRGFWTLETCKADALKYKKVVDWQTNSKGAYRAASINGWRILCTEHMDKPSRIP